MTTFVKWSKAYDVGKEHGLRVGKYKYQGVLYASSFENGIVTIEPGPGAEISWFCNIIVGCFEGYSNFRNEIVRAFNLEQNTQVDGIKCVFNDMVICIATKNTSVEEIYSKWKESFC